MTSDPGVIPADLKARRRALDVSGSFIVQAPAGSGKTELLIQRVLALLEIVAVPEEILAITFTRKAAAEMRQRLLAALERACDETPPVGAHAVETWQRARRALVRDRERDWGLLEHPARLQVLTIDSLCAALVRRMPYLSGCGEMPVIAEDASELYREAAERLCARLEGDDVVSRHLQQLLAHLDNRLPLLRDLLVTMLGRRDQWQHLLQTGGTETARTVLESALASYVRHRLVDAAVALGPGRLAELWRLGRWAAANLAAAGEVTGPLAALAERSDDPGADVADLPAWLALTHLLLTGQDQLRSPKGVNVSLGFPPAKGSLEAGMKKTLSELLLEMAADHACIERLRALRTLPDCAYAEPQWAVLAALIELLPLAVSELRVTFRQRSRIDFAEIAQSALTALGDELAPSELLLQLDGRLRHILVDEFQDTSRAQFDLLTTLTSGWERGDGRTLFLVGDPMQSIYRFRQAEVGLYLHARSHGIGSMPLEPLVLNANFRSQAELVKWCNTHFRNLFPAVEDPVRGAVPFIAAEASRQQLAGLAVTATCYAPRDDQAEAGRVVELVRKTREKDPDGTIAILVRARTHLAAIIPALKVAGLRFQAQEIDSLSDRPAIQDLLALTHALLHPADRVAWLAVLRAPWCGLTLDDLLALVHERPEALVIECLLDVHVPRELFAGVSADGLQRLQRVVPVLAHALGRKGRLPLRRLVESTWLSLGGPAGLQTADLSDVEQFLALLDELDDGGDLAQLETLAERLDRLFASADVAAGPGLQLMTLHKAKGLEFDTVILPGLGRTVGNGEPSMLLWQEDPTHGLLLAPIPPAGSDQTDTTYRALAAIHRDKEALETLRLFYVAATRARCALHLLGHTTIDKTGEPANPSAASLLGAIWPAVQGEVVFAAGSAAVQNQRQALLTGIRRLPADWSMPTLAAALPVALSGGRQATSGVQTERTALSLSLRSEEGRIVGTMVHLWLERIAKDGVAAWSQQRLATLEPQLSAMLAGEGIPLTRLAPCAAKALQALNNALVSRRGQWILSEHRQAATELALSGVVAGDIVHAVIDRTFIDEHGTRWIIDYKTSEPDDGESVEAFLEREMARYRQQLDVYRQLMQQWSPDVVRTALYLPLCDQWCEVR